METVDYPTDKRSKKRAGIPAERLRTQIRNYSKNFKTSWVGLGQSLCTVWQDRLFHAWGYDKFEYYVEQEVGLPKQLSLKLLKSYSFLEQEEPAYLKQEFSQSRDALQVPGLEAVNVLRLAKQKKELLYDDYKKLRKDVFDKGKEAAVVRRDLTALMKERKPVDPEAERDKRNTMAIRKCHQSLHVFIKDMDVLKLIPDDVVEDAQNLMNKLENHL